MHTYSTFAPAQERENYTYIDAFFPATRAPPPPPRSPPPHRRPPPPLNHLDVGVLAAVLMWPLSTATPPPSSSPPAER